MDLQYVMELPLVRLTGTLISNVVPELSRQAGKETCKTLNIYLVIVTNKELSQERTDSSIGCCLPDLKHIVL